MESPDDLPIRIKSNRLKLLLFILGASLFIGMGILMLTHPEDYINSFRNYSEGTITTIGIIAIVFFGTIWVSILKNILKNKYAIVISKQGIEDYSMGTSIGLVKWADIDSFSISTFHRNKFLAIILKEPEIYLQKYKNPLKKIIAKANLKMSGSPVQIPKSAIKIELIELEKIFNLHLRLHNNDLIESKK